MSRSHRGAIRDETLRRGTWRGRDGTIREQLTADVPAILVDAVRVSAMDCDMPVRAIVERGMAYYIGRVLKTPNIDLDAIEKLM